MNDEKLPPEDEIRDPDTDTGDEGVEGVEGGGEMGDYQIPQAIPVAEPTLSEEPEPAPAPQAAPAAMPRVFPQQYTLLFASTCMLAGCLTVWERAHVTGQNMYGFQMIGGGIVFAFSLYCVLTGVVSLMRGGVRFAAPLMTGFLALYFAIMSMYRTYAQEAFQYMGDLMETAGWQEGFKAFLGQWGPGIWLNLLGGLIIFWLFFKAMFGGKKKAEETASAPRRGRRR